MSQDQLENQPETQPEKAHQQNNTITNVCVNIKNALDFTGHERVLLMSNASLQRQISAYYCAPVHVDIRENQLIQSRMNPKSGINEHWYRRCVLLQVESSEPTKKTTTFGIALSIMTFSSKAYHDFYEQQRPGIGQLYAKFNLLPKFQLLQMGRNFHWTLDAVRRFYSSPNQSFIKDQKEDEKYQDAHGKESEYSWFNECQRLCENEWKDSTIWREYELQAPGIHSRILEVLRSDLLDC